MSELKDFQFDSKSSPADFETGPVGPTEEPPPKEPKRWLLAAIAIVLMIAVAATVFFMRGGRQEPVEPVAAEASPAAPPAEEPEPEPEPPIELPELGASDAIARELFGALSAHPRLAAWLATDDLIRRFTVSVVNISEGQTPKPHLRIMAPSEPFSTTRDRNYEVPSAKSYARYDAIAEIVAGLDVQGTVKLYGQLKPLIDEAFAELGYPGQEFHPVFIQALDHLLATPSVEADVALQETVAAYRYADPDLEALSAPQKQLLRMGPDNVRKIQTALAAFRRELLAGGGR